MLKGLSRKGAPAVVAVALACGAWTASAQEVTLRVHHILPPQSTAHQGFIEPWAERIMEQSNGRIAVEIFPAMSLGGTPPQLVDQVRDGVVDVVWTLPGYTPGRYPISEVFELPFMITSAEATAQALWDFQEQYLQDELSDFHLLAMHVHGRGLFHMVRADIREIGDLQGLQMRGPTRPINQMLESLGASAVGMPVTQLPQALSRGVVDGGVIPWEVAVSLRVHELVQSHTEFVGERGLYTSVFIFAMNRDTYARLPDDLKAVIDANSGREFSGQIGRVYDEAEGPGRQAAVDAGNRFVEITEDEYEPWVAATVPVTEAWIADMDARGLDGQAMYDEARRLIDHYSN